jgi:hypothetical protein
MPKGPNKDDSALHHFAIALDNKDAFTTVVFMLEIQLLWPKARPPYMLEISAVMDYRR